jgi:hypothetical protein
MTNPPAYFDKLSTSRWWIAVVEQRAFSFNIIILMRKPIYNFTYFIYKSHNRLEAVFEIRAKNYIVRSTENNHGHHKSTMGDLCISYINRKKSGWA